MSRKGTSAKLCALRLRLYVAGDAPNSTAAVRNLKALLARYTAVTTELEMVDVLEDAERAVHDGVLVTPTLIKVSSTPQRRIIGNLKDTAALISVLGLGEPDHE